RTCPPARRSVHVVDALPCRRGTHEANRRDTIVLDAVVFDGQIHPWSQLGLGALKLLLIKKFPAPREDHHRGDTIVPLAQIGRIAEDMDVVSQQAVVVIRHNLRYLTGLRGDALGGRLLGYRLRRDEENRHSEQHPLFYGPSPWIAYRGTARSMAILLASPSRDVTVAKVASNRRSEERRVGKECRSRWSPY